MKKNIIFNTIGNLTYNICQFLLTVLAVRLSTDYNNAGYLSLAMTTSSTFSNIALFGMRNFQISDVNNEFSQNEYISSRVLTCIISYLCCIVGAIPGNNKFQIYCIYAFMICRIAEALADVFYGIDQKNNRYDLICSSMVVRGTIIVISFSISLLISNSILVSIIVMSILNLIFVFFFDFYKINKSNKIAIIIITKRIFRLLFKCVPIVIYTFILSLITLVPKNVLQQVCGTNVLGIYSSITSPTLVVQLIASVAASPAIPTISRCFVNGNRREYFKILHKLYFAIFIMIIISLTGAKIFGKIGLKMLYGEDILNYYNVFIPAIICTIGVAIIWILYSIVVVIRKLNLMLVGIIVDFAIVLIVTRPLIVHYGMNGANYAQIIGYVFYIPFLIGIIEIYSRNRFK